MSPNVEFDIFRSMDIEHLRTFLEVSRTRHFGKAAENLFVTQSAVSARIRLLETTLGVALFTRKRNDVQLTSAGQRLLNHAETIVGTWTRARQEAGLNAEYDEVLAVAGLIDLWPVFIDRWLATLPESLPGVVITAETHASETLVRRLVDGLLDIGILFEPTQMPNLAARQIGEIELILVADRPGLTTKRAMSHGYISVDWGTSFSHEHARRFMDMPIPAMRAGLGTIGYSILVQRGGAAFLPASLVEKDLESKRLYRVQEAPVFQRPVYALYQTSSVREKTILKAVSLLSSTQGEIHNTAPHCHGGSLI